MKQIFAFFLLVSLVACNGNGESAEVKTDSTAVVADSTKPESTEVAVDTATAEKPAEVEVKLEKPKGE